jgi:hypothetical protein
MPPRRSARVAAVAERQCSALAPLRRPHALVLLIFSLVPVDQRLRCLEVCKGWYATLNKRSFWTRLDLSSDTAGLAGHTTQALLRAAAARAAGQLQALHLTDCVAITHEALLAVARANADTLTELRMEGCGDPYGIFSSVLPKLRHCWAPRRGCAYLLPTRTAPMLRRRTGCCATRARLRRCACANCVCHAPLWTARLACWRSQQIWLCTPG